MWRLTRRHATFGRQSPWLRDRILSLFGGLCQSPGAVGGPDPACGFSEFNRYAHPFRSICLFDKDLEFSAEGAPPIEIGIALNFHARDSLCQSLSKFHKCCRSLERHAAVACAPQLIGSAFVQNHGLAINQFTKAGFNRRPEIFWYVLPVGGWAWCENSPVCV